MKSFKLKDLMIQVQPNAPVPQACPVVGPTVCHSPTIVCQAACSVIACSAAACSLHPCTAVACSGAPCTAHPCTLFPCSAHPCSVFPCSAHPCSANACSAHPCSANVCSVLACSHACSFAVCSAALLSCPNASILPPCQQGSVPITITNPTDPGPLDVSGNLQTLKEQLKQQLAALEQQEKANEESMKPQSVEEVDDLQQKLQGALEELKTRRAELQQKQTSTPAAATKPGGREPGK